MNKVEERMIAKILAGGESSEYIGISLNTVLRIYNTDNGWNHDRIDVTVHGELVACYYPYLGTNKAGVIYLYNDNSHLVLSRLNALIEGLGFDTDKPDNGIFWEGKE